MKIGQILWVVTIFNAFVVSETGTTCYACPEGEACTYRNLIKKTSSKYFVCKLDYNATSATIHYAGFFRSDYMECLRTANLKRTNICCQTNLCNIFSLTIKEAFKFYSEFFISFGVGTPLFTSLVLYILNIKYQIFNRCKSHCKDLEKATQTENDGQDEKNYVKTDKSDNDENENEMEKGDNVNKPIISF